MSIKTTIFLTLPIIYSLSMSDYQERSSSDSLTVEPKTGNSKKETGKPIVILISGRGSNMMAIVEYATSMHASANPSYHIVAVISDNPNAAGLRWAQKHNIDTVSLPPFESFDSRLAYYTFLLNQIQHYQPYLVCLAGFMRVLPKFLIDSFYPRIINIHPSLLPELKGLDTHKRALENNVREHGCTVHLVVPKVDDGPIIAQAKVLVESTDTPEKLADRVLKKEHLLYPWVIDLICQNEIILGDEIIYTHGASRSGVEKNFLIP
jgi:phosphoribosylglycinamide formyltransferase-1